MNRKKTIRPACPKCGGEPTGFLTLEYKAVKPVAGNMLFCYDCMATLRFTDDLQLEAITTHQLHAIFLNNPLIFMDYLKAKKLMWAEWHTRHIRKN